jgi:hypothetical protein
MAKKDAVFIYIGTYANKDLAQFDYDLVKDLHWEGTVGGYDAAVISKDDDGKVHVNKDETAAPRWAASAGTFARAFRGRTSRSSASSSATARRACSSSVRRRSRTRFATRR